MWLVALSLRFSVLEEELKKPSEEEDVEEEERGRRSFVDCISLLHTLTLTNCSTTTTQRTSTTGPSH